MPSFSADYPEIARTLAASLGEPNPTRERPPSSFREFLRVFLEEQAGGPSIDLLDRAGLSLDPGPLAEADPTELLDLLRDGRRAPPRGLGPSLQRLARWVVDRGGFDALDGIGTDTLRDELRSLRGIGPATADRLLLEALGRPSAPVRRSDYRILVRHGWLDESSGYDEARELLCSVSPDDPAALSQLSSWLGELARFCRVASPQCDRCPLRPFLPPGGPIDPT
ncbi:endonuclease III [Tautonia sociabilis]|uniref:Endonuclease III n=1 Tax=Tautonia sociabilis TaxID=2080755 RepID=A0A432MP85_9BACT|nr:endonuclease III [Tautonia sociabilis]RUL89244.1 endonuclease III [Tautonia sociabilis]